MQHIVALPATQRYAAVGKIGRLELPFSAAVQSAEAEQLLNIIGALSQSLGIEWGGAVNRDALAPSPGFVVATTNCGDPHAPVGNEGSHSSVDASIATNCRIDHLNPAFNARMHLLLNR